MGSIIGHRIDYNGVGALRDQWYIYTQQKFPQVPPSPPPFPPGIWGKLKTKLYTMAFVPAADDS